MPRYNNGERHGLFLHDTSASMAGGAIALPFDNSYARLPERFYARLDADAGRRAAPDQAQRGAGRRARPRCRSAGLAAGRRGPGGQPHRARAPSRSRSPMPATSSATSCRSSATAAPSCWARSSVRDGVRRDIQLKGSGPTPFSRRGDGRAALGPVLREYIVSEAMAALGIPTTRSLAAVATGEPVMRETALPGAVLTRVASSHIRVGTFQFFAARGDVEALRLLADHVIARHYPDARGEAEPYRALFERVIARQAELVAQWMLVGFIHGVMNTDNCSIAGETIDYGPCAFMDAYNPETVFSSIDHGGRYAYCQPAAHRPLEPGALRRDPAAAAGRRQRQGAGHRQRIAGAFQGVTRRR